MARRIAVLILLLCVTAQATTRYVSPTGSGAKDGSSWANAGPPSGNPITWVNSVVVAGDTTLFAPGSYYGVQLVPPANGLTNDRTCYSAGDGTTPDYMYDPSEVSLGPSFTRAQFYNAIKNVPKACTLSAATRWPIGSTWSLYSGNIYYRSSATSELLTWTPWPNHLVEAACQDTIFLRCFGTLAEMTTYGAGSCFLETSTGRLYVWCTDGADPSTHTITASRVPTIEFYGRRTQSAGHVTFYGFDLRTQCQGAVDLYNANADSVLVSHCRVTRIGSEQAANPGVVNCYGGVYRTSNDSAEVDGGPYDRGSLTSYAYGNTVRACYLAQARERTLTAANDRFSIVTTYIQNRFIVESCYTDGLGLCRWKNEGDALRSRGCVARFNLSVGWATHAYETEGGLHWEDSCYGNIFVGNPSNNDCMGVNLTYSALYSNLSHGKYTYIANNTFYGIQRGINMGSFDDYEWPPNWIKYNIFYGGQGIVSYGQTWAIYIPGFSVDTSCIIDSNVVYNYPTNAFYRDAVATPIATWRAYQSGVWAGSVYHDVHSLTSNPNFVNVAGYDFRRAGSPAEMDVTYGGKRWTSFGAEGASGPAITTKMGTSGKISIPNGAGGIGIR